MRLYIDRYYEDLIEEGHPVAIFLHYLPLIIHEIDTAQSHAKSVHIIAREVLKRSKWVWNKHVCNTKARPVKFLDAGQENKLLWACASDFLVNTANTALYHRASLYVHIC